MKNMRWALLLMFVTVSCLPRSKDKDSEGKFDSGNYLNDANSQGDQSKDKDSEGKFDSGNYSNDADSQGDQSFYHKYRFSSRGKSTDVAVKVEHMGNGEFTLHAIDLKQNEPVNSIPLLSFSSGGSSSGVSVKGGRAVPEERFSGTKYTGNSYIGAGGRYTITYDGNLADVPLNRLPQIEFKQFPRVNGDDVVWQGEPLAKLSASDWQRLVNTRPKPPTYTVPRQLPSYLSNWFNNEFNRVGHLEKRKHNRAITFGGHTHYGAIYRLPYYEGWSNSCWTNLWGLDNVEVLEFLYQLRIKLGRDTRRTYISCSVASDFDFDLTCDINYVEEHGALRVVNNNLVVEDSSGIIGYMDRQGKCYQGRP